VFTLLSIWFGIWMKNACMHARGFSIWPVSPLASGLGSDEGRVGLLFGRLGVLGVWVCFRVLRRCMYTYLIIPHKFVNRMCDWSFFFRLLSDGSVGWLVC